MEFSELYMKLNRKIEVPIQKIESPIFHKKNIHLFVKRDDLNHPYISGNKLRKLKYNILEASKQNINTLLTFGGAFSNHILATAAAGHENGFRTIGVIRGEELKDKLDQVLIENETLRKAHEFGMSFHFISRSDYKNKNSKEIINSLRSIYGDFYHIPEGGTNELAIKGAEEIITEDDEMNKYDFITTAIGTGGTISGIINASTPNQTVLGFPVLKNASFLEKDISRFINKSNYKLIYDYHFGGYAKYNYDLIRFINGVNKRSNLPLDPIYTGKVFYGLVDLIKKDYFKRGSKIIMIHTGGLQGINGVNEVLKKKNQILIEK